MKAIDETTLLYWIGLIVEVVSVGLTALLFQLLRHQSGRRRYFRIWADAWVILTVSLLALLPFMGHRSEVLFDRSSLPFGLILSYSTYQIGKLIFLWLIVGGTYLFAHGGRWRRRLIFGLIATVLYSILSLALSAGFPEVLVWQTAVLVPAMFFCAYNMFRLPAERRTIGSRLTGSVFLIKGLIWAVEFRYFLNVALFKEQALSGALNSVAQFGSFADQMLQVILSIGFVLILMEEITREKDSAIAELAISRDQLEQKSFTDALTGALNRRAFFEGVGVQAARATYGSVCLFDLDNLKVTNDRYGHKAGDELIRAFVKVISTALSSEDRLYRWGGDEFLATFPNCSAIEAAETLNTCLNRHKTFTTDTGTTLPLEASFGVANYGGGTSLEEALEEADRKMYASKRARKKSSVRQER
ncbi:MAG: GGDEF domain-containing protein [Acidobacteria bacterium]|nr:GGDEF domain-containing protein [Acidobacteriota bacterium]